MENKDTDVVAEEYKGYPIAKTVTICGPRKFQHIMEAVKEGLEKNFITVHMPNFSFTKEEIAQFTPDQFKKLHDQHYRKMDQSDYVYIVNAGGYVGDDTQREIDYCIEHGIPLKWYCDIWANDIFVVCVQTISDYNLHLRKLSIAGVFGDKAKAEEICSELNSRQNMHAVMISSKLNAWNPVFDGTKFDISLPWDVVTYMEESTI